MSENRKTSFTSLIIKHQTSIKHPSGLIRSTAHPHKATPSQRRDIDPHRHHHHRQADSCVRTMLSITSLPLCVKFLHQTNYQLASPPPSIPHDPRPINKHPRATAKRQPHRTHRRKRLRSVDESEFPHLPVLVGRGCGQHTALQFLSIGVDHFYFLSGAGMLPLSPTCHVWHPLHRRSTLSGQREGSESSRRERGRSCR